MTKSIQFIKNSSFDYQITKEFSIQESASTLGTTDITINQLVSNGFSLITGGPTNISYVWQKGSEDWFIYDGTALWLLSNGTFSIINQNINQTFTQADITISYLDYSSEKNLFYYIEPGIKSSDSSENVQSKFYTFTGNDYSTFNDYSSNLNNTFPIIPSQYSSSGYRMYLSNITAHGSYFVGLYYYLVAVSTNTVQLYYNVIWSSDGTNWSIGNRVDAGIKTYTTFGVGGNIQVTSTNGLYFMFDMSSVGNDCFFGTQQRGIYGTDPSNLTNRVSNSFSDSCYSIIGAAPDKTLYIEQIGNYYLISALAANVGNSGFTQDFTTFENDGFLNDGMYYSNKYFDLYYYDYNKSKYYLRSRILPTNTSSSTTIYYPEDNPSTFYINRDGHGQKYAIGLFNNDKIFMYIKNYNSWVSCNVNNLVVCND